MLNTIIKIMFQQLGSIEELADDDHDDAKSDLFEDPTQANSKYSEGKFVRWGGEFHIEVPSDDEVYSISNVVPSSDPGFKTHLPNNRSASSPVLLTPKSPIDSGENETPVEEPSWWWSGSTARTPTATTFMQVDSSTAGVSPDGFISLMDSRSLPFGPSPPINSEGKRAQKVPDEDDDPGLGNPKRATGYNDGSTPASASPKVEEQTQNADKGGVMPYNDFSSSSGSSTYHIPLEEELSGRGRLSLSVANRLNHHAPEPSTQTHETNIPFPSFPRDDRNPLSLEDSLESRGAAGDRDDIVSDSTFGTEYGASIPYLFSDRDLDILAEKVLPLAHSRSAGGIHHRVVASSKQPAVSEKRRTRPALFTCSLCSNAFTTNHNLKRKSPTLQICVALSLMDVFQIILTLISVSNTYAIVVRGSSVLRLFSLGISRIVKVPKPKRCWNPPNSQTNLKTIRSSKPKDPCGEQRRVATTRPGSMFSASCRTTSSILPFVIYFALSFYIYRGGFFSPFQCPSPAGMVFELLFSSCRSRSSKPFGSLSLHTSCRDLFSPSGARHPPPNSSRTCFIFFSMVAASFVTSDSPPPGRNLSSGRIYL
jgi:hypothetical protein